MAWTTPRTWVTSEVVSASIMNTHVRDNFLATAPNGVSAITVTRTSAITADKSTSSSTMADLAGFTTSVVTLGGWLHIQLIPADAAGSEAIFTLGAAGTTLSIQCVAGSTTLPPLTIIRPLAGNICAVPHTVFQWWSKPGAATITVKLQWSTSTGTSSFALTGTAGAVLQVTEYLKS